MRSRDGTIIAMLFCLTLYIPYKLLKKLTVWAVKQIRTAYKRKRAVDH